uniref:Globin domain-containing protein n=1 Tax=Octopus bimaculoides TaxID=37653 RepID=A0A0L8G4P9_OCTBM|eukprot:XP_014784070.1 PREDICTED: cytoglobin-1-like [Octopus bimaculoides]
MGNQQTKSEVRPHRISINSVIYHRRQNSRQLNKYLTTRQIQLIQDSWKLIKKDLTFVGTATFKHFFETDQELKTFFPKIIRISEKNELEWDVDNDMLQRHGITVMRGLEAAVESLDDSQFLNNILFRIGQAHVYKNIKPHMLKRLWPSLNRSFKEVLKDRYNKDIAEAWRLTYQYICSQMKNGMENSSSQ